MTEENSYVERESNLGIISTSSTLLVQATFWDREKNLVAVEVEEGVAPGVEAQEGVVAVAEGEEGGVEGFDGGEAGIGVGVDLRVARVGGLPARGDGAGFDGLHGAAHFGSVPPTGIEQEQWAVCIGERERGGIGCQQ